MKKAFSLLEVTIAILVISILTTFFIQKSNDSIDLTNKTKIKSELALIRNAIIKQETKNTLLNDSKNISLDDENIEKIGSSLFKNILDFPLISTNSAQKELAKWIKNSQNSYSIFINSEVFLKFVFEDDSFVCKSDISLCKEYE